MNNSKDYTFHLFAKRGFIHSFKRNVLIGLPKIEIEKIYINLELNSTKVIQNFFQKKQTNDAPKYVLCDVKFRRPQFPTWRQF